MAERKKSGARKAAPAARKSAPKSRIAVPNKADKRKSVKRAAKPGTPTPKGPTPTPYRGDAPEKSGRMPAALLERFKGKSFAKKTKPSEGEDKGKKAIGGKAFGYGPAARKAARKAK